MTNQTLQTLANKLYKKYFHRKLNLKVTFNKRLRTTAGRTMLTKNMLTGNIFCRGIDINPSITKFDKKNEPQDTVKHELIHYYLFSTHQPCGHNMAFRALAHKLHCNVYMSRSWWRKNQKPNKLFYIYQCRNCGNVMLRQRKMKHIKNYYCANKIKDNFGVKVTCHGSWKSCGKITFAQLQKKNNKVDRLKKNFKHKEHTKDKYHKELAHILGYSGFGYEMTERSSIQGRMMNAKLGKILPKLSSHAQKQFIRVLNNQDIYLPQQAINKIKNKHFMKDDAFYDDFIKSAKSTIKRLKRTTWTVIGLQLETETSMGWYLCDVDDSEILDTIYDFSDENYTNGIKLFKFFIKFMKKHNQDYKKVEHKEKATKAKA